MMPTQDQIDDEMFQDYDDGPEDECDHEEYELDILTAAPVSPLMEP